MKHGDWLIDLIVSRNGKVGYIDKVLAAYRRHSLGVSSVARATVENRLSSLEAQLNVLDSAILLNLDASAISVARTRVNLSAALFMLKKKKINYCFTYFLKALNFHLPHVIYNRIILSFGLTTSLSTSIMNLYRCR
jgi:hypothetical protein